MSTAPSASFAAAFDALRNASAAGREVKCRSLLPAMRILRGEMEAAPEAMGGGGEELPAPFEPSSNVCHAVRAVLCRNPASLAGASSSSSSALLAPVSASLLGVQDAAAAASSVSVSVAAPPTVSSLVDAAALASARMASLLERAVPIIALQFLSGPDGRPLRDARGRPVPAWPEVANAFLSVASFLWHHEDVQRAAIDFRTRPGRITRLAAAAAAGNCPRVEKLLKLGADVNAEGEVANPGAWQYRDSRFLTPLSMAMALDMGIPAGARLFDLLLASGASVNAALLGLRGDKDLDSTEAFRGISRSVALRLCAECPELHPKLALKIGRDFNFAALVKAHLLEASEGLEISWFSEFVAEITSVSVEDVADGTAAATERTFRELAKHPAASFSIRVGFAWKLKSTTWVLELAAEAGILPSAIAAPAVVLPGAAGTSREAATDILWGACGLGLVDLARAALDCGAEPHTLFNTDFAANERSMDVVLIMEAAENGHADLLRLLATHQPTAARQKYAIFAACLLGLEDLTDALLTMKPRALNRPRYFPADLEGGSFWRSCGSDYQTPLTAAVASGNVNLVQMLLARGALTDVKNEGDDNGDCNSEETIVDCHALYSFCGERPTPAEARRKMLRMLLNHDAESIFTDQKCLKGGYLQTAITEACSSRNFDIALDILEGYPTLPCCELEHLPPQLLQWASESHRYDSSDLPDRVKLIKLLLLKGVSENAKVRAAVALAPKIIRRVFEEHRATIAAAATSMAAPAAAY